MEGQPDTLPNQNCFPEMIFLDSLGDKTQKQHDDAELRMSGMSLLREKRQHPKVPGSKLS